MSKAWNQVQGLLRDSVANDLIRVDEPVKVACNPSTQEMEAGRS
jgi:hypothetical protein